MNRRKFLLAAAPLAALPFIPRAARSFQTVSDLPPLPPFPAAGADGWVSLMNGRDLEGFYTFLQRSGRGVAEMNGMVTVENEMIHILGIPVTSEAPETGYFATTREFENYRLRLEYRWGVKRFPNRLELARNSGVQYHMGGEDRVWPMSVEFQMQQGICGDAFMVGGTRSLQGGGGGGGAATANPGATPPTPGAATAAAAPAVPTTARKPRDPGADFEDRDGWNQLEVVAQADRSMHLLNGVRINQLSSLQQPDPRNPGQFIPLTRGKIAIQIEAAEMWIRRFEIKSLA